MVLVVEIRVYSCNIYAVWRLLHWLQLRQQWLQKSGV